MVIIAARPPSPPKGGLAAVAAVLVVALCVPAAGALAAEPPADPDPSSPALTTPFALVEDRDVDDRLAQPEDRYALAGGCYRIESPGAGFVTRSDDGLVLGEDEQAAEPFHFQATRLGQYLIATNEGPETRWEDAWWDVRGYVSAATPVPVSPAGGSPGAPPGGAPGGLPGGPPGGSPGGPPGGPGPPGGVNGVIGRTLGQLGVRDVLDEVPLVAQVTVASEPSDAGDWSIAAVGPDPDARVAEGQAQTYVVSLPSTGQALATEDGALTVSDDPSPFAFHHVVDGQGCATWPEIDTNTSGPPAPVGDNPAGEVEGFFEAHVHGMAFEFLGGELRCGQPWHPYGVEHALGNCHEDGNVFNSVLEVAVAGRGPDEPLTSYDPVGWPTFAYWPASDTLTHEQFYWKWVERAYHGGLRLVTNLLVDNTALCQVYPYKRNSCNEMDGVRLQAQRMFELQDYIDAQSGGPGEGWLRIVTSPVQARQVINAGRLAVVLGIEVSELFDCREFLDVPLCSTDEIDERLQEVFDMGVRQMELINKFDNALSGVTGDAGETGLIVNTGNRWVTGHWWDMRTCADDDHGHGLDGDEHDKTQLNPRDDLPGGDREEIDVLAGAVLDTFGETRGYVAPVYPQGPHCNARGLTPLGEHLVREMIAKGMIFDPDHMSAGAMRAALDLIEHDIIPAERQAAEAAGRAPVQPAVISSHSWANDVVYQRIHSLDGLVAPRTAAADAFVQRWTRNKDWAGELASAGHLFGLGYGADTNGLGAQPGRRTDPAEPVDYSQGFAAPIGGVTVHQQTSGLRTYDINDDGVAHYGLFADWFHELALAADEHAADRGGGPVVVADMLRGPEAYLQMWERAVFGGNDCVDDQSSLQHEDLHALLGLDAEGFLTAAGAPLSRDGAAYLYCVQDSSGATVTAEVVFGADGLAAEVRSVPRVSVASQLPAGQLADGHDHDHHAGVSHLSSTGHGGPASPEGGAAAHALLLLGVGVLWRRFSRLAR